MLYGRSTSDKFLELKNNRKNEYVTLPTSIRLIDELGTALKNKYIFISINAQNLRSFMNDIADYDLSGKRIILCMKGLEQNTGKRLSEIVTEYIGTKASIIIWTGPGHIQDFVSCIPNCMLLDSADYYAKKELVDILSSKLIRFYIESDIIGNEIGAALKNVYGIAAGMLDGLEYTTLKGALVVRSAVEVSRFIQKSGGKQRSVYGLSYLGECETTFFSKFSNNRNYGYNYIKGIPTYKLCEGI